VLEEREVTPGVFEGGHSAARRSRIIRAVSGGLSSQDISVFQILVDAVAIIGPSPMDIPPANGQNPDHGGAKEG